MKRSVTIVITCVLICTAAFAVDPRTLALQRLDDANAHIRLALEMTVTAAPRIAEFATQLNQLEDGSKRDRQKERELFGNILEAAPAFWLLAGKTLSKPNGKLQTDPSIVRRELEAEASRVSAGLNTDCFRPDGTFNQTARCAENVHSMCAQFSSNSTGLTVPLIKDDLSVENVPVTSIEDLQRLRSAGEKQTAESADSPFERLLHDLAESDFQFCTAAALSGESFEATQPAKYPTLPSVANYVAPIYSEQGIRDECFAVDVFGAQRNVVALSSRFTELSVLKSWQRAIDQRANVCRAAIRASCAETYPIKGEIILAYLTKGCDVREVTAQDIDADVKTFGEVGLTRAEQLKHEQLKDVILLCTDALKHGYTWNYVAPSPKDCSEIPARVPKSKKPKPKKP